MSANLGYWFIISFLVMLNGFMILIGCLYSQPGSLFWGEAWIYSGAFLFAAGGIGNTFINAIAAYEERR
jgi:hypothetical protein